MNDEPDKQIAAGFEGFDNATDPTKLPPGICAEGQNVHCKGDGYVETRPGVRLNCNNANAMRGLGYFDQPAAEYIILLTDTACLRIASAGNNQASVAFAGAGVSGGGKRTIAQLLDKIFWISAYPAGNVINYADPTGAGFSTVSTFSDGTVMPSWTQLVVAGFRLLAFESTGEKLYASAVGAASAAANWVKTDNIRVGDGDGDPARALIASQAGFVIMLCGRSCWQINISDASVANWTSQRLTKLTGCVNGRTAIAIGQDVYFLSRYGVVNLGALVASDSISPSSSLSAPIQPYIDRINWSAIEEAFATKWNDLYLIALPLDAETSPTRLFPYNLRTRRWQAPWVYGQSLSGATTVNFGDKEETLLCDTTGRLVRIDDSVNYDEFSGGVQTPVASWALLRRMDHGGNQQYKQPLFVELVFQGSTGVDTMVSLRRDGATALTSAGAWSDQVGTTFAGGGGLEKKRWLARTLGRYREAALQVWATSGKLKLREATLSAFIDPPFFT